MIGTKWIFRNKLDEFGIDLDKTFALVARLEVIVYYLHLHLTWALIYFKWISNVAS